MSALKKKVLSSVLSLVLIVLIVGIRIIIRLGLQNDAEHQARLNSKPPKLEKLIDNMDKAGGIGAAMHDGSLLNGVSDPARESAELQLEQRRQRIKLEWRCEAMVKNNCPEAKAWLTSSPKNHFSGQENAQSITIVDQLAAMGATEIHLTYSPREDHRGMVVSGVVAKLPTTPAARKQVFAWYEGLPDIIEADDQPHPTELGQALISVEFRQSGID